MACKSCVKLFFHPGCASKHKTYDRNQEYESCPGPLKKFIVENEKAKTPIPTGSDKDGLGSTGSTGSSGSRAIGVNGPVGMDTKIDWLVSTIREVKDDMVCKREIKMLIKEAMQEEMMAIKWKTCEK